MDYELAKQLKDAGFPARPELYDRWWNQTPKNKILRSAIDNIRNERGEIPDINNFVYIPTLSELIEACGDDFESLVRKKIIDHTLNKKIIKFLAQAKDVIVPDGRGKTPEEAVAKLWLALNKK